MSLPIPPCKIAIGLSGGIDSAVTALFLSRCVHTLNDVEALSSSPPPVHVLLEAIRSSTPWSRVGGKDDLRRPLPMMLSPVRYLPLFMRNWEDRDYGGDWCETSLEDYHDAEEVAHSLHLLEREKRLNIHNYTAEYTDQCFNPMLQSYARGETLNVDILCNSKVKFGALLDAIRSPPFDASYLATGHYARTVPWRSPITGEVFKVLSPPLTEGNDLNNQTTFLSRISPDAIQSALFPLGYLFRSKQDVRLVAERCSDVLPCFKRIAKKKTSTGLCFVGKNRDRESPKSSNVSCTLSFTAFLAEYIPPPPKKRLNGKKTVFTRMENGDKILVDDLKWGRSRHSIDMVRLLKEYGGECLPSFALTIGQKVVWESLVGLKRTSKSLYVSKKIEYPTTGEEEVVLLREVLLVSTWDHNSLYQSTVKVRDIRFHVPLSALPVETQKFSPAVTECTLVCRCSCRHQGEVVPATVKWHRHSERADETIDDGVVSLSVSLRAIAPGQCTVLHSVTAEGESIILGSAWIVNSSQ